MRQFERGPCEMQTERTGQFQQLNAAIAIPER
jgi:hypothetical protein